ncbi:MAG: hypothetical protein M3Z05_07395 [Gemmatimonadota bacterium]|nr:hypothetical protein [Gemmatimonadota bacterium]
MSGNRAPQLTIPHRGRRNAARSPSSGTEHILQNLGAHPNFADSALGDLAEERAHVASLHGAAAAQWWYLREALRSSPHFLWNAVLYGGLLGRARVAAILLAVAAIPTVVFATYRLSDGPPARLVIGTGDSTADVVVNSRRPMKVSTMVLDAAGHILAPTGVQYQWASGAPMAVTPAGVITCAQPGDASIRVSLGTVATTARLRCRPVRDVRGPNVLNLVVGTPSQDVPFEALDPNGRPVTLLAGVMSVGDSTIVRLEGQRISARAAGATWVRTQIGDVEWDTSVHSYARASSLEGIRVGQHLAVPLRLASGEVNGWRLPASRGRYRVAMVPNRAERSPARVAIVGANCEPWFDAHSFLCAAPRGASVFAYVPPASESAPHVSGTLVVWREPWP